MSSFEIAFASEPALLSRISAAAHNDIKVAHLLHDISSYIIALKGHLQPNSVPTNHPQQLLRDEQVSKKRKIGQDTSDAISNINSITSSWLKRSPSCIVPDISVAVPLRKKLRLEVLDDPSDGKGGISLVTPEGEKALAMAWNDIDQIISVPVPEKAQPAHYFVALPVLRPSAASPTNEAIVFTAATTSAKNASFPGGTDCTREGETQYQLISRVFTKQLEKTGRSVVSPNETEFVSGVVQAHRKNEKGWHVKAWRGSRDGFLYFLGTGILFGFRKPLLFFPFHHITSISYSSVLQRTFNLNITHTSGNEEEELEFAMLDQADFAGIDEYVKRHGLHDASLAEARRARMYNINGVKQAGLDATIQEEKNDLDADRNAGEEEDELARRERALQDAEDAEEEDYNPSGGSSEGSGEDSDVEQNPGDEGALDLDEEVDEEVGGYEDEIEERD